MIYEVLDGQALARWHRDLELHDGQLFNIGAYLQQEGIDPNQSE